ncbi:hypothetical protein N7493_006317 [Penicillium malachiteum]|uniref:DC-UbP/UBTD2 N-terminal domain-containing protein n=1 Tax=Penicillium malachiteum TaxID=1324776 RepID=A0AAD6HKC3_9EURO|nr:hypothetical protein N7493_006317 [Penicillium malachiteum]
MGCCASTESRNHDDHDSRPSTQDHITSPNTTDPSPTQATHRQSRQARHTPNPNLPLDQHYNAPIHPHRWNSKRRIWTRATLDRERREFFETRVTGRAEIWAAVETAITLMRGGDLATAQSILDAAGITVPTGDLCEGCYDEQGVLYRLPQCIVADPENIAPNSGLGSRSRAEYLGEDTETERQEEEDLEGLSDGKLATDDASGDELIQSAHDLERRRDEKGKTRERDLIRVLARLSDGGRDLMLLVGKNQSVGFLARKVHQEAGISNNQRVRIAYLGHILQEHESLLDQGWKTGHVINALVVSKKSV